MKTDYNRDWLQNYRTNPKDDKAIYKNYQNPSMTQWDVQMGSLSPAQKEKYEQFTNTIPDEVKGLSAVEMQRYMQNLDGKQQSLAKERAGYDTQIQSIKAQQQARIRAQQVAQAEAQRRAQLKAQQAAQAEAQRQAQLRAQQAARVVNPNDGRIRSLQRMIPLMREQLKTTRVSGKRWFNTDGLARSTPQSIAEDVRNEERDLAQYEAELKALLRR